MHSLMIHLDSRKAMPLYQQIYHYLKLEIREGRLTAGSALPSKRKLAAYLNVSVNTVDAAYQCLTAEGYLEAIPKKGHYICNLHEIESIQFQTVPIHQPVQKKTVQIDFSPSAVDVESFPKEIWKKLYKNALESSGAMLFQKGNPQGDIQLRQALSSYLRQSRGVNCNAEQIIIGSGNDYLLTLLSQICGRTKSIAVENPVYEKTYQILERMGHTVYPLAIDQNGVPVQLLEATRAQLLFITPSHQFPLGIVMPIGRRIELLNWAAAKPSRYLIEDDYDSEFRYTGRPIPSLQGLDCNHKVVYVGAFSKSIAPSIRLSYMALPYDLLQNYRQNCTFYDCPVPTLEQKTIAQFLLKGYFEKHLNKMRKIYRNKRERFIQTLYSLNSPFQIIGDNAGHHILLRLKNNLSEHEMHHLALQSGIQIYPISQYFIGPVPDRLSSTVLLGYAGLTEKQIDEGLRLLAKAWRIL